jgi:hypothetical protein
MDSVTVVFENGDIVQFDAQEFDADFAENRGLINKYPYKDAQGSDSAIYLKPSHVAGIFLTKPADNVSPAVAYKVPGSGPGSGPRSVPRS